MEDIVGTEFYSVSVLADGSQSMWIRDRKQWCYLYSVCKSLYQSRHFDYYSEI